MTLDRFTLLLSITCLLPLSSRALDSDRDQLSDLEEINRYQTDPTQADTDLDGIMDGQEIIAGTDPLNPASIFHFYYIQTVALSNGAIGVELIFESKAARRYTLYHTTNLVSGAWVPVLCDIQGTGEMMSILREAEGSESTGNYLLTTFSGNSGYLSREVWLDVSGSTVADLTGSTDYPDFPDQTTTLSSFQAPVNTGDDYGQSISGYLIPPVSGFYTFWISADQSAEMWLSPNADPAWAAQVATVNSPVYPQEWTRFSSQESDPVYLEAADPCYVQVLHKEASGSDHLSVAWETDGMSRRVIDGAYCRHEIPLSPSVVDDAYSLNEDDSLTIAPYGVLLNDPDPDGDQLEAILESGVMHGILSLQRDGGFTYVPDRDFNGVDSFTYSAFDGIYSSSNTATVTLTVQPMNDPTLEAVNDFYAAPEGSNVLITAPGVLINDRDPDGLGLAAELLSNVTNGTLSLNTDGSFEYIADEGFDGTDQFTYAVIHGVLTSTPATVTLDMSVLQMPSLVTEVTLSATDTNMTIVPDINSLLTYENLSGFENLGDWTEGDPVDVYAGPQWTNVYVTSGVYRAEALISCPPGEGGTYRLVLDGVPLSALPISNTEDWDDYQTQTLADYFMLEDGFHTFKVEPVTFIGTYLCNLISVTLTPVGQFELTADQSVLPTNGILLQVQNDPPNLGEWSDPDAVPLWDSSDPSIDIAFPSGLYDCYVEVSSADTNKDFQLIIDSTPQPAQTLNASGSLTEYIAQLLASNITLNGYHTFEVACTETNDGVWFNLRNCIFVQAGDPPNESAAFKQALINQADFVSGSYPLEGDETAEAWIHTMARARAAALSDTDTFGEKMWTAFPLFSDWFMQDNNVYDGFGEQAGFDARGDWIRYVDPARDNTLEKELIASVCGELGRVLDPSLNYPAGDSRWLRLYIDLCKTRRLQRLEPLRQYTDNVVYSTHMHAEWLYLATETSGCDDGSQLREIDLTPLAHGLPLTNSLLFDATNGIVRDPEISHDAERMLFAWRPTRNDYDTGGQLAYDYGHYKIYEMTLADRSVRQLTFQENDPDHTGTYGADFEPCYLPNGNIVFSSARIVQEISCGWGDCSNLFIMDKDGKYARRVGFDQTQTAFPHLLPDGRVVYTRRDYNDRGQTYAHALFVMNPDGTQQTEYYGNNTFEPTSFQHTRPIPGTDMTLSIAGGYHSVQGGKLVRIDPKEGRQDYSGIEFYNWDYTQKRRGCDKYGREGEQYSDPYPIDKDHFMVSFSPLGGYLSDPTGDVDEADERSGRMRYKLYFMSWNGQREILAADPGLSCLQAVPIVEKTFPSLRASSVDYSSDEAYMYVENVYFGPSAAGIATGSIDRIRVSEIYYKPIMIGAARWAPPEDEVGPGLPYASVGEHSVLPAGIGTASFDAKGILGEAAVHEDGSAMFIVPARKPIYLQLIDTNGIAVQTMRSWATLMPNEFFSCVGCHEENDTAPLNQGMTMAMMRPPQPLLPFADRPQDESFSYSRLVQPIWDTNCMPCHAPGGTAEAFDLSNTLVSDRPDTGGIESTLRQYDQSYLTLLDAEHDRGDGTIGAGMTNKWVNYFTRFRTVELTPPYAFGSANSGLIDLIRSGHQGVALTEDELDIICAWIDLNVPFVGDYDEMNIWTPTLQTNYQTKVQKRLEMEAIEQVNIDAFIQAGQPQ